MKKIYRFVQLSIIFMFILVCGANSNVLINSVENTSTSKTVDLSTMAMRIMESEYKYESLYTPLNTLTGELTGYVYNCELCTGRLACLSSLDLSNGTNTYEDSEYGEVFIVASSRDLSCGSIVSFETSRLSEDPVYAIVLDRGVIGPDLDLLVSDIDFAFQLGRSNITYDVVRTGW